MLCYGCHFVQARGESWDDQCRNHGSLQSSASTAAQLACCLQWLAAGQQHFAWGWGRVGDPEEVWDQEVEEAYPFVVENVSMTRQLILSTNGIERSSCILCAFADTRRTLFLSRCITMSNGIDMAWCITVWRMRVAASYPSTGNGRSGHIEWVYAPRQPL